MAQDRNIRSLNVAAQLNNTALFLIEDSDGKAKSITATTLLSSIINSIDSIGSGSGVSGGGDSTGVAPYITALANIVAVVLQKTGRAIDPTDLSTIADNIGNAIDYVRTQGSEVLSAIKFDPVSMPGKNNISELSVGSSGVSAVSIPNDAFNGYTKLSVLTLPPNINTIGERAFRDTHITSLVIPEGTRGIGYGAFQDNHYLTRVTLNGGAISDRYAFSGCERLERVTIAEGVTIFPYDGSNRDSGAAGMFENCTSLKGDWKTDMNAEDVLTLPASVTSIPGYFLKGSGVPKVRFLGRVSAIGPSAFEGENKESYVYDEYSEYDTTEENRNIQTLVFDHPESLSVIGESAFKRCASLSFTFNSTFTSLSRIYSSAFQGCKALSTVFIPASCARIDNRAFDRCTNLAAVTFGENSTLTTIEERVFRGCSNLSSISLPPSITSAGENIFEDCDSLTTVGPSASSGARIIINFTNIPANMFKGANKITSVNLSNTYTIGASAFQNCSRLTTANLTGFSTVSSIGENAFNGTSLTGAITLFNNCTYYSNSFPSGVTISGGTLVS